MEKINIWLIDILNQKFDLGTEQLSQLSSIELLYLYAEIYMHYNILLTITDIQNDCFASIETLSSCISNKINLISKEVT